MEDDYGENWEEEWWERYETEKQAKSARKEAELKSLARNLQVEEEKGGNNEPL